MLRSKISRISSGNYWVTELYGSADDDLILYDCTVDTKGNMYFVGRDLSGGNSRMVIIKLNRDTGEIEESVGVDVISGEERFGRSICTDASDNVYVMGQEQFTGTSEVFIASYTSDLTERWARKIDNGTNPNYGSTRNQSIVVNSLGELVGNFAGAEYTTQDLIAFSINASDGTNAQGANTFRAMSLNINANRGFASAVDSNDNHFIASQGLNTVGNRYSIHFIKYNSSNVRQAQRTLESTDGGFAVAVEVDSADNIYLFSSNASVSTGDNQAHISKWNSSLNVQWQKELLFSSLPDSNRLQAETIDVIDNDDIIVSAFNADNPDEVYVVRLDDSGNILWQNKLSITGAMALGINGAAVFEDAFYICLEYLNAVPARESIYGIKVPLDGSRLGVYGDFVYEESTALTVATTSWTQLNTLQANEREANDLTNVSESTTSPAYTVPSTNTVQM